MKYRIELIWNREFDWSQYREDDNLANAKQTALSIINSGDGARVKKVRVINNETNKVEWPKY